MQAQGEAQSKQKMALIIGIGAITDPNTWEGRVRNTCTVVTTCWNRRNYSTCSLAITHDSCCDIILLDLNICRVASMINFSTLQS